jgi:hypothetical protein
LKPKPPSQNKTLDCPGNLKHLILTKGGSSGGYSRYGYSFHLLGVIDSYLRAQGVQGELSNVAYRISDPFLSACWHLCLRGVLRPSVYRMNGQAVPDGGGYSLTAFGAKWIEDAKGSFDYVPTEPGHLAELISKHSLRFGMGFNQRAQDAVRCHSARAYLACCAMCGAGAESIFLALENKRNGDPKEIEKLYVTKNGRSKIEGLLVGQQPAHIQNAFRSFTGLLKYWRDESAHGREAAIDEVEAFTSVVLLIRFAQFAADNWDVLTSN